MTVFRAIQIALVCWSSSALCANDWPAPEWDFGDAFTLRVGGRVHLDHTETANDRGLIEDDSEVRRARLYAKGTFSRSWKYKFELDFAGGERDAKDFYVQHRSGIRIGEFKTPFSLEEQESSNTMTFAERGLPTALVTSRRSGIGWFGELGDYQVTTALYERTVNDGDEGTGVGARVSRGWEADNARWHAGAAVLVEEPSNDALNQSRFRARPEIHIGPRLVDTGRIENVDRVYRFGVEAAWQSGPWSAQAEWMGVDVARDVGPDARFSGAYVYVTRFWNQAAYRSYAGSYFSRVVMPEGGLWQSSLRYSYLDLNDADIEGSTISDITLGTNYYFAPNVRVLLDVVWSDVDELAADPVAAHLRLQVDF